MLRAGLTLTTARAGGSAAESGPGLGREALGRARLRGFAPVDLGRGGGSKGGGPKTTGVGILLVLLVLLAVLVVMAVVLVVALAIALLLLLLVSSSLAIAAAAAAEGASATASTFAFLVASTVTGAAAEAAAAAAAAPAAFRSPMVALLVPQQSQSMSWCRYGAMCAASMWSTSVFSAHQSPRLAGHRAAPASSLPSSMQIRHT